jgi:hypothetical protein
MYVVALRHIENPDLPGGYWSGRPSEGPAMRRVATMRDAAQECVAYIERNRLGSGNWAGGQVFADKQKQVARISYNGTAWGMDGTPIPT